MVDVRQAFFTFVDGRLESANRIGQVLNFEEDRMIFARGAVAGAAWLIGREAGRYTMPQVLGL